MPKGYKRLINKERERKDVIQIIDDEGFLREISFDDLTSHPVTLAGYGITDAYISNGTIYLGNQSITPASVSSLGTAAYKDYTASVIQGSTDLPTSDAVFQAIGAAVSSALHYRGISSTIITDGGTETAVIDGQPLVVQSGDVVIYSGFEFLWENDVWNKLGDDTSFALKTVQITGDGIYIIGGGDLTTSRSLGLSQAAIDALALASTALQSVAFSDLTSHPTTLSGYGITDANISNGTITLGNNTITPLTSFTETDPTVSAWAKAASKPTYTLDEVSDGSTRKLDNYVLKSGVTVPSTVPVGAWNTEATIGTVDSKNFKIKFPAKPSYAFSDLASHPTTLSGYGITDAKIANGTITLGGNSITPLTSFIETDPTVPSWAKASTKPSYSLNEITGTDDLRAIEALSGIGLAKRTADNTWELTDTADKAKELVTSTEEDAMFTYRHTPSVAVGDMAKVLCVKGKSIVWNQILQINTNAGPWTSNGVTMVNNRDGSYTFNGTATDSGFVNSNNRPYTSATQGHKYYIFVSKNSLDIYFAPTAFNLTTIDGSLYTSYIATSNRDGNPYMRLSVKSGVTYNNVTVWPYIIDLTQMFGAGNEPATVEEFEALYHLPYYDYDTGELVNNAASGVEMLDAGGNSLGEIATPITEIVPADKPTLRLNQLVQNGDFSQGRTGWGLRTTEDTMDIANGEITVTKGNNNSLGGIAYSTSLVNNIDITHRYYIAGFIKTNSEGTDMNFGFHASNGLVSGNTVLSTGSTSYVRMSAIVSPSAATDRFTLRTGIGSSANGVNGSAKNVICIDLTEIYGEGSEPTNIIEIEELIGTDYIPYTTGEDIPNRIFSVGMKSAGSVADEWSGTTATKRIGVVDLGRLTWIVTHECFYALFPSAKLPASDGAVANILCKAYSTTSANAVYYHNNGIDKIIGYWSQNSGRIIVYDSSYTNAATFKAAMSGVLLYYELKEPETYTVDALPDTLVPFDAQGTQRRLPVDTSEEVAAPMVCDFQYGANIGDVIKSINNNTEEYRKKSDNNFTSIETGEIHCTGDIEANGNLTINDVIASAINAQGEMSIPTQMPGTIELGRVFMYYDEAVHQLCIRESDGTIKTIQFT